MTKVQTRMYLVFGDNPLTHQRMLVDGDRRNRSTRWVNQTVKGSEGLVIKTVESSAGENDALTESVIGQNKS